EQEGQQTETEATGAPQKHHYTLNQQVGSITGNDKGVKNITMPTNSFLPFYRLLLMCFYL
ncbi:hypothetical protein M2E44_22070, partial [Klebsiella pneumoniae]|nr:hypothetical protein [Klebsiella pneumoniae]